MSRQFERVDAWARRNVVDAECYLQLPGLNVARHAEGRALCSIFPRRSSMVVEDGLATTLRGAPPSPIRPCSPTTTPTLAFPIASMHASHSPRCARLA